MTQKERISQQRNKTVWNLSPLFKHDDDPRIEREKGEVEKKSYEFINAWKDRIDYLKDPLILRQALDEYEKWKRACGTDGNPGYYFWLRTQQDQNDPENYFFLHAGSFPSGAIFLLKRFSKIV